MKNRNSKKGFTLVEIMIVVVIIGLLAAMAIPAFQKVRTNSRHSAMDNDARQIASAAQQYMLENSVTTATLNYTTADGKIAGQLLDYVKQVSKGYTGIGTSTSINQSVTFSIIHTQGGTRTYNAEGQLSSSSN